MMRWKKREMDNRVKVAELQLRGRRVDNCWRLHMTVALKYVTLVLRVLNALCCINIFLHKKSNSNSQVSPPINA